MIENLHIQGYRGISDLEINDLGPINIFVGYNSVGKTTILEAIGLLVCKRKRMLEYLAAQREVRDASVIANNLFTRKISSELENKITISAHGIHSKQLVINVMDESVASSMYGNHDIVNNKDNPLPSNSKKSIPGVSLHYGSESETIISRYAVHRDHFHTEEPGIENKNSPSGVFYISSGTRSSLNETAQMFNDVQDLGVEEDLFKYIRDILPDISRIRHSVSNNSIGLAADFNEGGRGLPVNDLGDGFNRLLLILTGLYSTRSSYLIVDDIDSGFHYSSMEKVWNILSSLTQDVDIPKQIFCVTHNDEMLSALLNKHKEYEEKIRIFRISKDKEGKLNAIKYTIKDFEKSKKFGLPVR